VTNTLAYYGMDSIIAGKNHSLIEERVLDPNAGKQQSKAATDAIFTLVLKK